MRNEEKEMPCHKVPLSLVCSVLGSVSSTNLNKIKALWPRLQSSGTFNTHRVPELSLTTQRVSELCFQHTEFQSCDFQHTEGSRAVTYTRESSSAVILNRESSRAVTFNTQRVPEL